MEWKNGSLCLDNRFCTTVPLFELQNFDSGSDRKYKFQFHAFNVAGHFCEIFSEDFSLPSPFPPTHGTVFDVEHVVFGENNEIKDIDVSFSLNSYCVFLKNVDHTESLTYEIGVGLRKFSDDVIPLHPVNGTFSYTGWVFCETVTQLKTYDKYYVYLKAYSTGVSISLSSDGFVIVDPKDFGQFIKVNDGEGCSSQTPLFKQNLANIVQNDTKFNIHTQAPMMVGKVYTTFINVSKCDFHVNSEDFILLSTSYNSLTFIPLCHQPVYTFSMNCPLEIEDCVLETFRCEENIQVQNQHDIIGANWKVNEILSKYISHYKVSLMSCGRTENASCETVFSKLVTNTEEMTVFQGDNNLLIEGFYKVTLQVCFGNQCIFGGHSDGFYVESNDPETGRLIAELDLQTMDCAYMTLDFEKFRCSCPLKPFATFYKWALFTDSDGLIQITSHNIHLNDTGNHEVCCIVLFVLVYL